MTEILAQIDAKYFCAGLVLQDDVVVEAAPIIGYMQRQQWTRARVREHCARKHWTIAVVYQRQRGNG